jgi:2-(1,2-epoxy-1,2-dihydrophenyl)acetyl-CoA isomerase
MSEYDNLQVDREDGVATVRLAGGGRFNSLDAATVEELLHAATELCEDDGVRCLALTGEGAAFCAGADLSAFEGDAGDAPKLRRLASGLHDAILQFHQAETPLVVGVNGVAAGGGFGLALSGDVVVMSEDARLEYAYRRIGLTGDGGSTFVLPRLVGLRRAKEIALLDEPIGADHAVSMGLVTESVPAEEFDERFHGAARDLASGPTAALGATKRLLTESFQRGLAEQMAAETDVIAGAARTEDWSRGHAAFFTDEEPEFTGR